MFAGIDIASERHTLARLDDTGAPIGKPVAITEDREGYDALLKALSPAPVLVVMEATGHYWKNLFATLTAAGHDIALLNPFVARRFQDSSLERTKTDAIDAHGLARLGFEKRPAPARLHDEVAESLREMVRHRDRLRQDFDDRVRQLHRLVDLGFPEFTRYVRTLDSMLATCLLAEYPTAQAFARANPRRLAKLRYDGRHLIGAELAEQLVEAAKRSIGQHHGPAYTLQARHICQDLDLWRRRLADIERDIENLLDTHEVGKLLTTIEGIGPQSAPVSSPPSATPPASAAPPPSRPMSASSPASSSPASVPARAPPSARSAMPVCAWRSENRASLQPMRLRRTIGATRARAECRGQDGRRDCPGDQRRGNHVGTRRAVPG